TDAPHHRVAHSFPTRRSADLTPHQYAAGSYFGWLYRANAKVRGWPSPNVQAIDYGARASGFSIHPEDSDEYVADIKKRWQEMYRSEEHTSELQSREKLVCRPL